VLRHPEVLECDARWRARAFAGIGLGETADFDGLEQAAAAIAEIDQLRRELEAESRQTELSRLFETVRGIRSERNACGPQQSSR